MINHVTYTAGNRLPILTGQFVDGNGDPVNVSTATISFGISRSDGTAVTLVGSAAFQTDGTDGRVKFTWGTGDLDAVDLSNHGTGIGTAVGRAQFKATFGSQVMSCPNDDYIYLTVISAAGS